MTTKMRVPTCLLGLLILTPGIPKTTAKIDTEGLKALFNKKVDTQTRPCDQVLGRCCDLECYCYSWKNPCKSRLSTSPLPAATPVLNSSVVDTARAYSENMRSCVTSCWQKCMKNSCESSNGRPACSRQCTNRCVDECRKYPNPIGPK
ncbi:uncharacterized protein LOC144135183 isoform X2 [Amblyomma americanum]